jgi:signal transduction histidine kinase/ligand-binding sensor domain-containing protein
MAAAGGDGSAWFVRSWQSDDGLPNSTVTGVAETPDGYLWLATPSGLARFDGVRFEPFSLMGYVGDQNRGILAMSLGERGGLTMALDRGAVLCLNSGGTQVSTVSSGMPDLVPQSIIEDGEGTIWVAYRGGTMCRIKGGALVPDAPREEAPAGPGNYSFASDTSGRVWFFKAGHFGCYRDGRFANIAQLDLLPTRLVGARDGGVWICSGPRIIKYSRGRAESLGTFDPEDANTEPAALLEDHTGALWIGTTFRGLFRYEAGQFEKIPTSHSQIFGLAEDHQGNVWAATGGGGLNRIRPRAVALEGVEAGLPFETVQSVCEDKGGNLWATTQDGSLVKRLGGKWTLIPTNSAWPGSATCLAADPSGAVWVGTLHSGLFCWRDGGFVPWESGEKLRAHSVHALLVSRNGDLWIEETNPNGLQRLRMGKLETLKLPGDIRGLRAIAEDAAGNVWLGTSRGVLLRVTGNRAVDVTREIPHFPQSIRCLYTTPDGSLWIGFAGWGLGRFKDGHLAEITSEQGLYDDYISRVVGDGHGWFWFGSDRGIFKVRQSELDDVAGGRASSVRSIPYGRDEGLPSLQASFGDSPSGVRGRDGLLWLPMRTGLASIDPGQFNEELRPVPVLISRIAVDGQTRAWYGGLLPVGKEVPYDLQNRRGGLRLSPGHRQVQIDYAALDLTRPEAVRFRYRMRGLDETWIEGGAQRSATYLRLPSGNYQFEVRACSEDGVWSETGADLSFLVDPFIWETWWFRTVALAALTLGMVVLVRYVSFRRLQLQLQRAQREAALHQERTRIAKDIHDDLGANLTQIALLSEFARQDRATPERVDVHTEKISTTARQAVKSLDEIVWAVNPHNDTLAELIDYTQQFALDYLQLAGVRCRFELPEKLSERDVSADVRHNLFLVVKEALNNVVKHSKASEVWLRFVNTDDHVRIVVEDNGHGFEGSVEHRWADGLKNMLQRMQEAGGKFTVESQPGQGTRITLELPWGRGRPSSINVQ